MTDRRRINGPPSGTSQPVFTSQSPSSALHKPRRTRRPNELRKIYLTTGVVPAATGSAYLELELPQSRKAVIPTTSTLKLTCSVHGPKPVSRTSTFSPNLQLTTSVKFAPFASRQRRGYIRDAVERDIGTHLETALRGVVIPHRWPKSAIDVVVTVLEGEEDFCLGARQDDGRGVQGVGMLNVLAGCITVASAALADARIDCLDLLAGGVAAVVFDDSKAIKVLDPCPAEHDEIQSACLVGYLFARDELTETWIRGELGTTGDGSNRTTLEEIVESAVQSSCGAHSILQEAVKDSAEQWIKKMNVDPAIRSDATTNIVEMKT